MYKYSPDATRLANVSQDGRIIIWNNASEIQQQYSPSSHLSAQITCLAWSPSPASTDNNKKKKKKKGEEKGGSTSDLIALGTTAGTLLVYSVKQGDIVTTFDVSNHKVLCLTWSNSGNSVVCGTELGEITICCVLSLQVLSRFKADKRAIHALAITNDDKKIIAASQKLKVFEVHTQDLVQTFAGHSNPVVSLCCLQGQDESFVMSVAAEDRNVSIWKLDAEGSPKPTKADPVYITLSVNEDVRDVSCVHVKGGEVMTCATTESGKASMFRYSLEKAKKKPIKAYSFIKIMNEDQDKIKEIPVLATHFIERDMMYLTFTYGSETKLKLEDLKVSELRENHILAREMPMIKLNAEQQKNFSKVVPMKDAVGVKFLMAGNTIPPKKGEKRRNESKKLEQTLEERLALLEPSTAGGADKTMSFVRLLMQGLQSKNESILMSVLDRDDTQMIESTLKSLPVECVVPLLQILHKNIQSKGFSLSHVIWAQSLVRNHVGFLVSSPHVHTEILLPLSDLISARTANFLPILKLKGKIEMIKGQMERNRAQVVDSNQQPLVVYQDESDEEDAEALDKLLPPRVDYDSDFLDEYLSDGNDVGKSSEDENDENESGSSDSEMETDGATVLTNGHGKGGGSEDDMVED